MDALHLNVKKSVGADFNVAALLDEFGETNFVGTLDGHPPLSESSIVDLLGQSFEERQVFEPLGASQRFSDQVAQMRIGLVQPSARSDAIGLVDELFFAVVLNKVFEDLGNKQETKYPLELVPEILTAKDDIGSNRGFNEVRVQCSDTVHFVGANNSQMRHADLLGLSLLDNRHAVEQATVIRKLHLHLLQEELNDIPCQYE